MSMKRYAVADEVPKSFDHLTAGKEYEIIWQHRSDANQMAIEDDDGDLIIICPDECAFLAFRSWRIVEREE